MPWLAIPHCLRLVVRRAFLLMGALTLAGGGAEAMEVRVTCQIAANADPERARTACSEMTDALARAFPAAQFKAEGPGAAVTAEIEILRAGRSSLGLALHWITDTDERIAGKPFGVSVSDQDLTAARRASVYRRALTANPMPPTEP